MICIYNSAQSGMLSYFGHPQNYILPFGCCFWPSVHALPKPSAPRPGSQRRYRMKNRWHSELSSLTHIFIFTYRLLGSHLFKHLKNTLLSPAREQLDQQTLQMCCRVNVAPRIERAKTSVCEETRKYKLLQGVY